MNDETNTPTPEQPVTPPQPTNQPLDPIRPPAPVQPTPPPVAPGVPPTQVATNRDLAQMLTTDDDPNAAAAQTGPSGDGTLQKVAGGFMAVIGGLFSWIIFPLAVVLILHYFVFQAYHVLGTSMNPTLQQTDYLIISKVGYTESKIKHFFNHSTLYFPKRGQIIVFHYPKDPSEIFVKRVIGLPGDHIVIKSGTVTVFNTAHPNGYNPDAGYEPAGTTTLIDTDETVQPGNIFVMGDNRTPGGSYDSREWGELPSNDIIGNAVMRLLPLDAVKIL